MARRRRALPVLALVLGAAAVVTGCGSGTTSAAPTTTTGPTIAPVDPGALGDVTLPLADGTAPPIPTTLVPPELELPEHTAELDIVTCHLEVTVPNESLGFSVGSSEIPPGAGRDLLAMVAAELRGVTEVSVLGHSSSEGDPVFNLELSKRRAQATAAIIRPLLPGTTFVVDGVGPTQPLVVEDGTEATRAPNRRVEISGEVTDEVCHSARNGAAVPVP